MKILLIPQVYEEEKINYEFPEKGKIIIDMLGEKEEFDFKNIPNGKLNLIDEEGKLVIPTKLEPFPIISAEKKEGVLYLELLNWTEENAPYEVRFPEWIDYTEY